MAKTKRNHPTACRGLNKTNCIFPCEYVKSKMDEQIGYCRSKYKRMIKIAKTEKQKKKLEKEHSKTMKKLNDAKSDIVTGTKKVEKATNSMSILGTVTSSFGNLFKPKEENPKIEEPEPEPEVEVEKESEEIEPEEKTEEEKTEEEKKEEENK